jgi:protein-L-isoaspartate O-methyltransferase
VRVNAALQRRRPRAPAGRASSSSSSSSSSWWPHSPPRFAAVAEDAGVGGGGLDLLVLSQQAVQSGARSQGALVEALQRNGVLRSAAAASALAVVDRALFIPSRGDALSAAYAEPYENRPAVLDAASGATLSAPHHHAVVTELVAERVAALADRGGGPLAVLDYGAGTGYLSHVFAELLAHHGLRGRVMGSDAVPSLLALARSLAAARGAPAGVALEFSPAFGGGASLAEALAGRGEEFDVVHAGFAVPEDSALCAALLGGALRPGGSFVGALQATRGAAQELCVVTKDASSGALRKRVVQRPVLCQAMLAGTFDEIAARLTGPQRIQLAKEELEQWKAAFERRHGRAPTREEMTGSDLFKRFAALRARSWDK